MWKLFGLKESKNITVFSISLVDGGWSSWMSWQPCDATCGKGHQLRTRLCDHPSPKLGGKECDGRHKEFKNCNLDECKLGKYFHFP